MSDVKTLIDVNMQILSGASTVVSVLEKKRYINRTGKNSYTTMRLN